MKVNWDNMVGSYGSLKYGFNNIVIGDTYKLRGVKWPVEWILDIGGNVGYFSLYSRELFPLSRIISVEGSLRTFKYLEENVCGYGIEVLHRGICECDGCDLLVKDVSGLGNMGRWEVISKEGVGNGCKFMSLINEVGIESGNGILKVDCEGCEDFIMGELEWLGRVHMICVEFHNKRAGSHIIAERFIEYMSQTHEVSGLYNNRLNKSSEMNFIRRGL